MSLRAAAKRKNVRELLVLLLVPLPALESVGRCPNEQMSNELESDRAIMMVVNLELLHWH